MQGKTTLRGVIMEVLVEDVTTQRRATLRGKAFGTCNIG